MIKQGCSVNAILKTEFNSEISLSKNNKLVIIFS